MKGLRFTNNGALYWDGIPPITAPATIGCFMAAGILASPNPQTFIGLTIPTGTVNLNYFGLGLEGQAFGNQYSGRISGPAGGKDAFGRTPIMPLDVFELCMLVWFDALDVRLYNAARNPTVTDIDTANLTGASFTRVTVGGCPNSNAEWFCNGHVASPFVYRRILTRADYLLLAAGMSPEELYPQDLAFHIPNLTNYPGGSLSNWYGGQPATLAGVAPVVGTLDIPRINFPVFA